MTKKKTEEDLLKAAADADLEAFKECLADGVSACWTDYRVHSGEVSSLLEDVVSILLGNAGSHKNGSDIQTMECIKLLFEKGNNYLTK